jgi:hypothetical protein
MKNALIYETIMNTQNNSQNAICRFFYNFKSLERFSLSFNAILILEKLLIIKYTYKQTRIAIF